MKSILKKRLSTLLLALLCTLSFALPAFAAALAGNIDTIDAEGIKGWAWNSESMDETVTVELHIFADDNKTEAKTIKVIADNFSPELSKAIGDGYHYFNTKVNWSELTGTVFQVKAYAVSGEERLLLPGTAQYKKSETSGTEQKETAAAPDTTEYGPGADTAEESKTAEAKAAPAETTVTDSGTKGKSLGMFTTTAYCNCTRCSGGHNKTYSGTVPKANHTISADLSVFPLGTKLMIGNTIYTVEDKGSGVNGRKLDIFFGSHSEALAYGMKSVEVFAIE